MKAGYKALRSFNRESATTEPGNSDLVRDESETMRAGSWRVRTTWTPASATRSKPTCRRTAIRFVWLQYLPVDDDLLDWLFGEEVQARKIRSPLDISDVWTSSNSSNTNEILWGAKFATRFPWITCVLRLSSYECGMDQPTYTPTQKIVEATGTLFFKFGDLDSTKPAGSIKIRIETIVHYLAKYSQKIMQKKLQWLSPNCPLGTLPPFAPADTIQDEANVASQISQSA